MKTQSSRQHTNVVAVQPQTSFHKEDRMNRHSSTALKMAIIFAMVVTLAMTAPSAGAQTLLRYLQMPGSGQFTSGQTFTLPGYGQVQVTETPTVTTTFFDQTGAYNKGAGGYHWGTDTQRLNMFNGSGSHWDYTLTFNFENGAPDLNRLIVDPIGLAFGTTAAINQPGTLLGQYNFGNSSTTVYTPGLHGGTFSSADDGDPLNTGWALFKLDQSDGHISSLSLNVDQISGDGIGFTLGYASQTPEPSSLMLFGSGILGLGGFLRKRLLG